MLSARVVDLSEGGARLQGAAMVPAGVHGTLDLDGVAAALPFTVRDAYDGVLGVAFELDETAGAALRSVLETLTVRPAA